MKLISVYFIQFTPLTSAGGYLKSNSHLPEKLFLLLQWKPCKNYFYFTLKAFSVLKIVKLLSWLFGYVGEAAWLER